MKNDNSFGSNYSKALQQGDDRLMKYDLPEKFDMKANAVSKVQAEQAVLIVGHPMTDYRRVESVLQGVGMLAAQKTRQQGLEPTDISAHLLKRAGIVPDFSAKIEQVAPSPIWQILALDLFLGNSESGFWGWSDPQSIYLLDYWHATDPAMHFIFVYDSLEHVLVRASAGQELSREAINQLTNEWQCFYTALMHFYHRHRERCLLVHAEQACANPEAFDKALSSCLQRPLQRDANSSVVTMALGLLEASLAANMVKEQHAWLCSYEELQSQADFPLSLGKATDSLAVWNAFSELSTQMSLYGKALTAAENEVAKICSQLDLVQDQKAKIESRLNEQQALQNIPPEVQQENELLLLQLHQVQEELERYYLENQQLKCQVTPQPKQIAPKQPKSYYGAAERVKRQLSYRLGAVMIAQSKSFAGWLGMPSALLREAREYDQEKAKNNKVKLPQLSQYADANEGERVKRHLSYRLGATLLTSYKSPIGWIKLPWLMRKQIREFKRERATK